ncbi:MAG: hypothetical protein KatS3mg077_2957 [Candidatus Binatia bacterium]|nr:MAG: hypothetical protein KatS3mg077_2957 [Candidatus Binatia bacterium]
MNEVIQGVLAYFELHPDHGLGLIGVIIGAYYLLNYRPRMVRDAERRLAELREERANLYRGLRPPNGASHLR